MELILTVIAILFAIIAVVWGGYQLWNRLCQGSSKQTPPQPRYSVTMLLPLVIVSVVLSSIIGMMISAATLSGFSYVGAPGVWLGAMLGRWVDRNHPNIGVFFMTAFVVNSALCLAILWGGYWLWFQFRRRRYPDGSNGGRIQRLFF